MTRDPFGGAGDFVTSPEVSQIFGELVGLWAASVWKLMGEPENVRLVELGPGRGTMMLDAMRAANVVPPFRKADILRLAHQLPHRRCPEADQLAENLADLGRRDEVSRAAERIAGHVIAMHGMRQAQRHELPHRHRACESDAPADFSFEWRGHGSFGKESQAGPVCGLGGVCGTGMVRRS